MSESVSLRVSDAEREAVVSSLRNHAATGRLDASELEERIGIAFAARTADELDALQRDLPTPSRRSRRARAEAAAIREHLQVFIAVQLLLVVIWAATGLGYFWPIWPLMGWGIGLGCHALGTRRIRSRPAIHA